MEGGIFLRFIENIYEHMQTDFIKDVQYFDELTSTNDYGVTHAKTTQSLQPTLIVAKSQTNGKGQKQRIFHSPSGGLYMSLVFYPQILTYDQIQYLTIAGVVAVVEAIEKLYKITVDIKWLNDIYIQKKKICGILLEAGFRGKIMEYAVLGIGLNTDEMEIPEELQAKITTIAKHSTEVVTKEMLIATICDRFSIHLQHIESNKQPFMELYQTKSLLTGMQISLADTPGEYTVKGIAENGMLIVEHADGEKKLQAGSVRIIAWQENNN